MAENKKGFVLYADLLTVVKKLVEQDRENGTNYAGELFLTVLEYVNDLNPIPVNFIVDMAFEPIKLQLKRDLKKYEVKKEQWSKAGKKSAEVRQRTLTDVEGRSTDSTVTVKVKDTVTVKDTVKVIDIKEYRAFKHLKLSFVDFDKLLGLGYTKEQVDGILDSIENYKKNTNYTSLYLTAVKWLKKEYPEKGTGKIETFLNNVKLAENL